MDQSCTIMGNLGIRTLRLARDRRSWSFTRARCETKEKKKSATEVLPPAAADCACAIRLDEGKESERETTNCPPKRVRSTFKCVRRTTVLRHSAPVHPPTPAPECRGVPITGDNCGAMPRLRYRKMPASSVTFTCDTEGQPPLLQAESHYCKIDSCPNTRVSCLRPRRRFACVQDSSQQLNRWLEDRGGRGRPLPVFARRSLPRIETERSARTLSSDVRETDGVALLEAAQGSSQGAGHAANLISLPVSRVVTGCCGSRAVSYAVIGGNRPNLPWAVPILPPGSRRPRLG